MHQDREERAIARNQLREVIDLAAYPSELVYQMALSPTLYNPGTRRFEFQRTPNRFIGFSVAFGGAGSAALGDAAVTSLDGSDLIPRDGKFWRVLGVRYSFTVAAFITFADSRGGKVFEEQPIAGITPTSAMLPGNGILIPAGGKIAVTTTIAGTLLATLYVAEEEDTSARGSV